ncbi:MAG: alanine racemase [Clostridiales bacterium]|nr:alanine racemase [Clostridiales bacterium]
MQNVLAVISLKKIISNAEAVCSLAGVPLIAVVKDDAYGHGAERVALALNDKVSAFAVSTVDEGAALRLSGIQKDILVLTPPLCEEEVVRISEYGLIASLTSLAVLRLTIKAMRRFSLPLRAHLAVNTGMNRYGFRPERVEKACALSHRAGIQIEGIYSHFYLPQDENAVSKQRELFDFACEEAKKIYPNCLRHVSATGGLLAGVKYDAVRAGISLYGYLPEGAKGELNVEPAMKLYATVAQRGTQLGDGIGYRAADKNYGKIHTLRLGYGDGFFRAGGLNAVGSLCMDACVRKGDGVVGARRLVLKDVTEYAHLHGTTEYEVLVNVAGKAVKVYV